MSYAPRPIARGVTLKRRSAQAEALEKLSMDAFVGSRPRTAANGSQIAVPKVNE
jgi:hypothetical protein